jgi:hypothetical protein
VWRRAQIARALVDDSAFFLLFANSTTAASRDSPVATPAFFGFAKRSYHGSCSACRRFVCHVSGRVFRRSRLVRDAVSEKRESAQGKKKSFVQSTSFFSVFSRRTLFSHVRGSLRRSFSRRDFCASPRMPPQSRVSAQVVRNIFGRGDSEAGRSVVRALRLIRHALVLLPTLIGAGDTAGGRWL